MKARSHTCHQMNFLSRLDCFVILLLFVVLCLTSQLDEVFGVVTAFAC